MTSLVSVCLNYTTINNYCERNILTFLKTIVVARLFAIKENTLELFFWYQYQLSYNINDIVVVILIVIIIVTNLLLLQLLSLSQLVHQSFHNNVPPKAVGYSASD